MNYILKTPKPEGKMESKEEKPSTSAAAAAAADAKAGGDSSSKTWKCEGKLVSSKITPTILETYNFSWETTLKQIPGEKFIKSKSFVLNTESENESFWRIELDPNFTDAQGTRYLSAYLVLEKTFKPDAVLPTLYHISLIAAGNSPYIKSGGISKFSAEKPSYGFPKFIPIPQLGKLADPNNTLKVSFGAVLQIFKENVRAHQCQPEEQGDGVGVGIEEMDQDADAVLPFDPAERPTCDSFLLVGKILLSVDSTRVNHFTDFFIPYYIPSSTDLENVMDATDMAVVFGSRRKIEKLMEFCHTCRIAEFPKKLEGVIGMMDMAESLQIEPLKQVCGLEILDRLDITNFVQIVELAFKENLSVMETGPAIWKFMIQNIDALNQCKEFKDTYDKYKDYYAHLMVMDEPSTDDDYQVINLNQDDGEETYDFYT